MITFKKGGVHPEENKLASVSPIEIFPVPKQAVIFLGQHFGVPAISKVSKGDRVKTGQLIATGDSFISANIHSSVSGVVSKVDNMSNISSYQSPAIVIDVDGDEWESSIDITSDIKRDISLTKEEIVDRIKNCGIVGLGGACFPTHVKYIIPKDKHVDFLIINGAECEPYITADHRIMIEHGEECLIGINALLKASSAPVALVGIESNKIDAIEYLTELANKSFPQIKICSLKVKYPQGAEKQLIQALTNRHVPSGKLPVDVGVIVNNITTTFAVYEAVQKNKPLIETFTTISGKNIEEPHNYKIRIGTSISEILSTVGIPSDTGKIISGGPMMGKAISNINSFVTKGMSSFLFLRKEESKRGAEYPCLHCGRCISVCPMGLDPSLLSILSKNKQYEYFASNGIMNCMECGSCQFECPSNKPLLDFIRLGKTEMPIINAQ